MGYTQQRLEHVLEVFRTEEARAANSSRAAAGLEGHRYGLRRLNITLPAQTASPYAAESSSDDEYTPLIPKKRVLKAKADKNPKRQKTDADASDCLESSKSLEDTTEVPTGVHAPSQHQPSAAFVTLQLKGKDGKVALSELAKRYGTGYRERPKSSKISLLSKAALLKPEERDLQRRLNRQRLEISNAENSKIDDSNAKVLRNRKILYPVLTNPRLKCSSCLKFDQNGGKLWCSECSKDSQASKEADSSTTSSTTSDSSDSDETVSENEGQAIVKLGNNSPKLPPLPAVSPPADATSTDDQHSSLPSGLGSFSNPIKLESPPPGTGVQSILLKIATRFAHPMTFQHMKTAQEPCHFCSDFRYGIHGLGKCVVEVIKHPDSSGYEETGNGHRSRGHEATRMCVICALARLRISRCINHRPEATGQSFTAVSLTEYSTQVLSGIGTPFQTPRCFVACALCPQAAFWRCRADQTRDRFNNPLSEAQGKNLGCGLVLCDRCAARVRQYHQLRKSFLVLRGEGMTPRADVDFLFPGSMLHQAYKV